MRKLFRLSWAFVFHFFDAKKLAKVYEGKVRALDGVDLRVFALLGPNAAGKTFNELH
jgi:ABC-type uncharacterized transport system ATPase subunit